MKAHAASSRSNAVLIITVIWINVKLVSMNHNTLTQSASNHSQFHPAYFFLCHASQYLSRFKCDVGDCFTHSERSSFRNETLLVVLMNDFADWKERTMLSVLGNVAGSLLRIIEQNISITACMLCGAVNGHVGLVFQH